MRKIQEYLDAGRNNPYSPEQMQEHAYDFVSLPDRPTKGVAVGHDRLAPERWTGRLTLVYQLQTPLHVGSGVFETAEECGLRGGTRPVRGMVRSLGRPVLPGSSWKGAVRARFEAITASRLGLAPRTQPEPEFKVPEVLRKADQRKYRFDIDDPKVRSTGPMRTVRRLADLSTASPADVLFGCMGYRGRVQPQDGIIRGALAEDPLRVAAMDSPNAHRLAKPGGLRHERGGTYKITAVEGRKFYYDGELLSHRKVREFGGGHREVYDWIDHVPAGATITFDLGMVNLTSAEVGAVLLAAGHGDDVGIVRFGGFKSAGLGKVRLQSVQTRLVKGASVRRWKLDEAEDFDLDAALTLGRQELVDAERLQELHRVTTMRRPGHE